MNKRSAYNYVRAMSKAAAFALRIKKANEFNQDKKPTLTEEDIKNLQHLYFQYYGKPYIQDIAMNQYRRFMEMRDARQIPPFSSDPSVND